MGGRGGVGGVGGLGGAGGVGVGGGGRGGEREKEVEGEEEEEGASPSTRPFLHPRSGPPSPCSCPTLPLTPCTPSSPTPHLLPHPRHAPISLLRTRTPPPRSPPRPLRFRRTARAPRGPRGPRGPRAPRCAARRAPRRSLGGATRVDKLMGRRVRPKAPCFRTGHSDARADSSYLPSLPRRAIASRWRRWRLRRR